MASHKENRAKALKELRLAREGGGRAKQYKVCLVATALDASDLLIPDTGQHRHRVVRRG